MLNKESNWIQNILEKLEINSSSKILNFGSQTKKQLQNQPALRNVVLKIYQCNSKLINLDINEGEGVDIVGNILEDSFASKLSKLNFDIILVNNVLEHVENIELICQQLQSIIKIGGYIIFSGPYKYPKHLDPIDNMFRPEVEEVAKYFPKCKILESALLKEVTYSGYILSSPRIFISEIARLLIPFYKYNKWKTIVISKLKWLNKHFQVICVHLQKVDK